MLTFTDEDLLGAIERDTGVRPTWSCETFTDLEDDVRASRRRILDSPFIPEKGSVRVEESADPPAATGAEPARHQRAR
jgi:carbonic anhydrase